MSHVDSASPVTHVSLCAGYGGIDLGLSRAIPSLRTIAFSEIEAFACANLVSKMEAGLLDPAPIWTDLKTFPWAEFHGCVDILSGGYPCQPFSAAGKRLGAEDPRHLWPFIAAGIAAMRPGVCFFENVDGHVSMGLPDVLQDLAGMGYRTTWCVASASECGAPHQRKRIFILAHRNGVRLQQYAAQSDRRHWQDLQEQSQGSGASELADSLRQRGASGLSRSLAGHEGFAGIADDCGDQAMANAELHGRDHANARPHADGVEGPLGQGHEHRQAVGNGQLWPSRPGEQQFAWEPPRVVVDTKGQRAGQRSELCSEECGSRGALPRDVEQSGEGGTVANAGSITRRQTGRQLQPAKLEECGRLAAANELGSSDQDVANDHSPHAGHGEQWSERTSGDLSSGCGEAMDDAARLRSAEPADGRGQAAPWADASGDQAMGNAPQRDGVHASRIWGALERQSRRRVDSNSGMARGAMGHANSPRPQERPRQRGSAIQGADADGGESAGGEIKPELGLLLDGSADGLGGPAVSGLSDQELAEIRHWMGASTNRTDSLRLLGNGVVPATAERAFRVLVSELMEHQP